MEKEINIAAILRDKPHGLKLYDVARDINVFYGCQVGDDCEIHCDLDEGGFLAYNNNGTLIGFPEGMQILKPSKAMQDWNKFAWKKGDVLYAESIDNYCIFNKFTDDEYTTFKAAFELNIKSETYDEGYYYFTSEFHKAPDEVSNNFIKKIEEHYGGKLNLDTLAIEKPQFKPMDWCLMRRGNIDAWHLCQYSDTCDDGFYAVGGNFFKQCIPYNDQTKHLLGTTDEWKGGE